MENWKKEAEYVSARLAEDDKILFTGDDGEPLPRNKHDEFVKRWGFSYNDIWDLDKAIVMFILPRMAYYREHCTGYPTCIAEVAEDGFTVLSEKEAAENWNHILDAICEGLHCYLEKDFGESEEKREKWNLAKKYLFDYFEAFWNQQLKAADKIAEKNSD